mmetsp:Transcript_7573/g.10746  ORF Transcript_7573/g.10746 Transcript_7573/m.10746 type:complete len:119 (-) Transcript_7573:32-388(-)
MASRWGRTAIFKATVLALTMEGNHVLGNRHTLRVCLGIDRRLKSRGRCDLSDAAIVTSSGAERGKANATDALVNRVLRCALNEALVGVHLQLLQVLGLAGATGREEGTGGGGAHGTAL